MYILRHDCAKAITGQSSWRLQVIAESVITVENNCMISVVLKAKNVANLMSSGIIVKNAWPLNHGKRPIGAGKVGYTTISSCAGQQQTDVSIFKSCWPSIYTTTLGWKYQGKKILN